VCLAKDVLVEALGEHDGEECQASEVEGVPPRDVSDRAEPKIGLEVDNQDERGNEDGGGAVTRVIDRVEQQRAQAGHGDED